MARLVLTIEGKPGSISLDSFLAVVGNSFSMLKDLDSAISHKPDGSLSWLVTGLSVGSLAIEIRSKPNDAAVDLGEAIAERYLDGIEIIRNEGVTPPYFSDSSLKQLQKVARALGHNGADSLKVIDPAREKSAVLHAGAEKTAGQLIGRRYRSFGSVEGTLEMISIHGKPRFNLYHSVSLRAVRCSLSDEFRETVAASLGRRVAASGLVSYNVKDEPISVMVDELAVIPKEDELPAINEFIGSDPDFTGDISTEEYIRSMRSA